MDPERAQVKAAGCVVWRRTAEGEIEIALAHRPRYDDWSLPKGKLEGGEDWAVAALRETEEEIGQRGKLGPELPPVFYRDRKGRDKVVRYWLMEGGDASFTPNDEVDELRWETLEEALERLTYPVDRDTVGAAGDRLR
jgi:8-oxo-dGTP diphosphatase